MELKEGMYVRTKFGYICEIININDFREPSLKYGVDANYLKDIMFIGDDDIKKASFNIIDLIEEGDYVNGQRVNYINKDRKHFNISFGSIDYILKSKFNSDIKWLSVNEIKSIVTKEMFETMKYEVE